MSEPDTMESALTPAVAAGLQDLRTQGWTMLSGTVSDRLRRKLRDGGNRPNYHHIRQTFDGLPQRIAVGILGRCVFSGLVGPPTAWARGRPEIVASEAPREFVPGLDFYTPIDEQDLSFEIVLGSARLRDGEIWSEVPISAVTARPGDLISIDARTLRRARGEKMPRYLGFGVVREWITPLETWPANELEGMPPRAAAFFGKGVAPSSAVDEWLVRTHERRA